MRERVQYYFREIRGFKYDEVNAVLAVGVTTLADRRSPTEGDRRKSAQRRISNRSPQASSESTTS